MPSFIRSVAVALVLLVAACSSKDPIAASGRTVAEMAPKLSRALTPAAAEQAFGQPDERLGSGLIIYMYRAEAGKRVFLSFPGHAPIVSASVQSPDGTSETLLLRD